MGQAASYARKLTEQHVLRRTQEMRFFLRSNKSDDKFQTKRKQRKKIFYILLTVHLDAILGNNQLDALFLNDRHVRQSLTRVCHTRWCINTIGPPDDEHLLLETYRGINKYIKKECIKLVISQKENIVQCRNYWIVCSPSICVTNLKNNHVLYHKVCFH
jgi:hypothetical protein